jgi:hypothetical protein
MSNDHNDPGIDIARAFEEWQQREADRPMIDAYKARLRVEAAAREELASESQPKLPAEVRGPVFLVQPDRVISWRIKDVFPVGGNVMLTAQFKAGKTTLRDNFARSWCDGVPLLGKYPIDAPDGPLFLIDVEMTPDMARRWLSDQGIKRPERFYYANLRGQAAAFNLLMPNIRAHWVTRISGVGAGVVVLDCLGPVLASAGLDENSGVDVGRFLSAWEATLAEAGVTESVITHHMGHSGERSRGASRFRDWPDAEWLLVRQDSNPGSPRYFSASGRDVDVAESRLDYDPPTRRLALIGGSRGEAATEDARARLRELLASQPDQPLSGAAIERALAGECPQRWIRAAIKAAINRGEVVVKPGPHNAALHSLSSSVR